MFRRLNKSANLIAV